MKEFRVQWTRCPTNFNSPSFLFIEAGSREDAKTIATNHIERSGVAWFVIYSVSEITTPIPEGRVKC